MFFFFAKPRSTRSRVGFTLVEIIVSVAVLAIVAGTAVGMMSSSRSTVVATKLQSDTQKLNEVVSVYLSEGGSLNGLTTPQSVLDKLKSVRPSSETQRNVGVMTGRGVDVRLSAKMQTSSDAASNSPRVAWDATNKKFVYSASSGAQGVADFVLDDTLLGATIAADSRQPSKVLYNGADGWVWAPGSYTGAPLIGPPDLALNDLGNAFNPNATPGSTTSGSTTSGSTTSGSTTSGSTTSGSTTSGSTTSGSTTSGSTTSGSTTSGSTTSGSTSSGSTTSGSTPPGILPSPIITPGGGTYVQALFPTQIYINPNGAPDGSSILEYKLNDGPWLVYTGPFSVASGTKVTAYNKSTAPGLYTDSSTVTEAYYFLVASFTGTVASQWNASEGPPGFYSLLNNSNPNSITETDGTVSNAFQTNQFTFNRVGAFTGVAPNAQFSIGTLSYRNGTINTQTDNSTTTGATALHLHLDITMTSPAVATTGADINISLINTINTTDAAASADIAKLANPITNYSVTLYGVTYTLVLTYGAIDVSQGFVTGGNELHVYEGATGTVPIIASFVSSTP